MAEFLPICDVLFNVISLAGYFCDIVFDMVFCYALMERGRTIYVGAVLFLVGSSLITSQIVSLRWYLHKNRSARENASQRVGVDKHKMCDPAQRSETVATDSAANNAIVEQDSTVPDEYPSDATTTAVAVSSAECMRSPAQHKQFAQNCVILIHCAQLGVLWRYAKLFVPVDLRHVKHEVRDLCMLRLMHAFCEAAPMLLLQLYVLVTMRPDDYVIPVPVIRLKTLGSSIGNGTLQSILNQPYGEPFGAQEIDSAGHGPALSLLASVASSHQTHLSANDLQQQLQLSTFRDLNVVSAIMSLFSVCWALASFSKNVRLQNVHRLVLTWLGVIFQFLWRLGTIVSRVAALTMYASLYGHWIFLVLVLHWVSMFLWLISPKNVFHGERISHIRKATLAALIAGVYVFAYVNLQQTKHRQKMVTFYVVMFLENWLLVCLWLVGIWPQRPDNWSAVPMLVLGSFLFGMAFMVLYYRYFHVRRLGYEAGGRLPCDMLRKYADDTEGACTVRSRGDLDHVGENVKNPTHIIPGVFNCRFSNVVGNGAAKRKKKMPTTFIPPPALPVLPSHKVCGDFNTNETSAYGQRTNRTDNFAQPIAGIMPIPFWRRPLPRLNGTGGSSENEGSAGSRVNIQQKLQEKKQKQLAELKIIEEEIKQGKLGGPLVRIVQTQQSMMADCRMGTGSRESTGFHLSHESDGGSSMRQPIPHQKLHINVDAIDCCSGRMFAEAPMHGSIDRPFANSVFNNLNMVTNSENLDEVNNLNKFNDNYNPLYNSFGLNSVNIPALNKDSAIPNADHDADGLSATLATAVPTAVQPNLSPKSSQISTTESNSLPRSCSGVVSVPRTKMLRNPFTQSYNNGTSAVPFAPQPQQSPRNFPSAPSPHPTTTLSTHPRHISGMYSSGIENAAAACLPFPYRVLPPPRSKLESIESGTADGGHRTEAATLADRTAADPFPVSIHLNSNMGRNSISPYVQSKRAQQHNRLLEMPHQQRQRSPEILLSPHYLDNSRMHHNDWVASGQQHQVAGKSLHQRQLPSHHNRQNSGDENDETLESCALRGEGAANHGWGISDVDSQVSLPRSYTLPREFKYYRRNKIRNLNKSEHCITSTNSSDGDVDSGDDNESDSPPLPLAIASQAASKQSVTIAAADPTTEVTDYRQHDRQHRDYVNQSRGRKLISMSSSSRGNLNNHHKHMSVVSEKLPPLSVGVASTTVTTPHSYEPDEYGADSFAGSNSNASVFGCATQNRCAIKPINYQLQRNDEDTAVARVDESPLNNQQYLSYNIGYTTTHEYSGNNGVNRQTRQRYFNNCKSIGASRMPRHETKL